MKNIVRKNRTAVMATLAIAALSSLSTAAFGQISDFDFATPLPEPETLALLAIGAVALVVSRWTRRK